MRLCLVEDIAASGLEPLTLTRPVHELLLGATIAGEQAGAGLRCGPWAAAARLHDPLAPGGGPSVSRPALGHQRPGLAGPGAGDGGEQPVGASRRLPHARSAGRLGRPVRRPAGLCPGRPGGRRVAGAAGRRRLVRPDGGPSRGVDVGGEWIARPWDLVARNGAYLERDFAESGGAGVSNRHLTAMALVGPADRLRIHETARIDPYTVFDTTNGPIILGPMSGSSRSRGSRARARSAADTQLFRANLRGA